MKKQTKKKIFNSAIGVSIAATVATPFAIALEKDNHIFSNLFNIDTKETTKDASALIRNNSGFENNDGYQTRVAQYSTSSLILMTNPNTVKSTPRGYLCINKNHEVMLVGWTTKDNNNDNWDRIIWKCTLPIIDKTFDGGDVIKTVEYNAAKDAAIILWNDGKSNYYITQINSISNLSGDISNSSNVKTTLLFKSFYNGAMDDFGAKNMWSREWGMVPVWKNGNWGDSNSYAIFPRLLPKGGIHVAQIKIYNTDSKTYKTYNTFIDDNNWSYDFWESRGFAIHSAAFWWINGKICGRALISGDWNPYSQLSSIAFDTQYSDDRMRVAAGGSLDSIGIRRFFSFNNDYGFSRATIDRQKKAITASPLGAGVWVSSNSTYPEYGNAFKEITLAWLWPTASALAGNSPHVLDKAAYIIEKVDSKYATNTGGDAYEQELSEEFGPIYIDNAYVNKHGLTANIYGSPMYGQVWNRSVGESFWANYDSTNSNSNMVFTTGHNNSLTRVYQQSSEWNITNTNKYKQTQYTSHSMHSPSGLEVINHKGFVVPEYTGDKKPSGTSPNNYLYGLKNQSNQFIIIDQNRENGTTAKAKTGLFTRFMKWHSLGWDYNVNGDEVTVKAADLGISDAAKRVPSSYTNDELISKTGVESNNSKIYQMLGNPITRIGYYDTQYTFNPNEIKYNYGAGNDVNALDGEITVSVYANARYSKNGYIQYTDDLSKLKNNWWSSHKIGTIKLTGFKHETRTALRFQEFNISNLTIKDNTDSRFYNQKGNTLLPSFSYWKNEGLRGQTDQTQWEYSWVLDFIWQSITNQLGENNNIFKNLKSIPKYSQNWTQAEHIRKVFDMYFIQKYNDENGTLQIRVRLNSSYMQGLPANSTDPLEREFSFVLTGMRVQKATKWKSNSSSTPIVNSAWSNKNIPYINNVSSYQVPSWVASGTSVISENEIRQYIYDNMIKTAFNNATDQNGYDCSNNYVDGVAVRWYNSSIEGRPFSQWKTKAVTKENIVLSGWNYYPAKGMFRVDVRLNVYNAKNDKKEGNGVGNASLHWTKSTNIDGTVGTEQDSNAPVGTFYFGGFRKNNVTTELTDAGKTDVWHLKNLNNISITDAYNSAHNYKVELEILRCAIENNYLTFPYWVNIQDLFNKLEKDPSNSSLREIKWNLDDRNLTEGSAIITLKFRHNGWVANNDGSVKNTEDVWVKSQIKVDGFRPVTPIKVDSSKVFEFSQEVFNQIFYLSPDATSREFVSKLTAIEEKIVSYIHDKDVEQNTSTAAQPLDAWKSRLKFKYVLKTPSEQNTVDKNGLQNAIKTELSSLKGQLGYLYNSFSQNGIKIWLQIIDEAPEGSISSIEDASTDANKGTNLFGLINSDNIILNLDLRDWKNAVEAIKGTTIVGGNELNSWASSITPPTLTTSGYGQNVSWEDMEMILESSGYNVEYQWIDSTGTKRESTKLPTNFTYNPTDPIVTVRIKWAIDNQNPYFNIFGDTSGNTKSWDISLSLAVKKQIAVDVTSFERMHQSVTSNINIEISSSGKGNTQSIIQAQSAFEEFETNWFNDTSASTGMTAADLKNVIKITYSINGSAYDYTYDQIFEQVNAGWAIATSDINQIGKLRFYSKTFSNGTKIDVKVSLKDPALDADYKLNFNGDKQNTTVNHGFGTTFDMSKYRDVFQTQKATAGAGSTADDLKGFTPPAVDGIAFDDLKQKFEDDLGISFQFSSTGTTGSWEDSQTAIRSVNANDPAVYMRLSAAIDNSWSNEFNIKNFATGVTNSESNVENEKWSSGVKLQLDLPKYLTVDRTLLNDFVNTIKPLFGGNTKNMTITDNLMKAAIRGLVNGIIQQNKSTTLTENDFAVEFKVNASSANAGDGMTFTEYNSAFLKAVADSNTWNTMNNGVYFRIILKGKDDGAADHDNIKTTYNNDQKEYALSVSDTQMMLFDTTNGQTSFDPNLNPIKFYLDSIDDQLSSIIVNGKSTTNISFTYGQFYFDQNENRVYADATKKIAIQFSKDVNLTENNAGYNDPNAGWTFTPPTEISADKLLFVRAIANYDNCVYGPALDSSAKAVKLDTSNIKPVISADINSLTANININGIINVIDRNNTFDINALKAMEKEAINQAIDNETGRKNVEVVYILKTSRNDNNTNWLTLDELLEALNQRDYASSTMGIISFINGQYSLKVSLRSTNPEMNVIDSVSGDYPVVQAGVDVDASQIVTNIDLSDWIHYLETTKALVVDITRANSMERAIVDLVQLNKKIQPRAMRGQTNEDFLSGRSFDEIVQLLKDTYGVTFKFSTDKQNWVNSISRITQFDDSVNKLYMQVYGSSKDQIKIISKGNAIDSTQNIEVVIPIQYPKTIVVQKDWLDEFINSKPANGNTKYLEIDKAAEDKLIQHIIDEPLNQPAPGDPTPDVWVEYKLDSVGWLKRDAFIQALASANDDQVTNKISFRLQCDPVNEDEPVYNIDEKERVLQDNNISASSNVKIFINHNYENEAGNNDKVSVKGSDDNFAYNYGTLPIGIDGTWSGAKGLSVQWTTDKSATYADDVNDSKWSSTQISVIDPVERYLAIRFVVKDGYEYSAIYSNANLNVTPNPEATIHVVNTDEIKSGLTVDLDQLASDIVLEGDSNKLDLTKLKDSESAILASIAGGDKLAIRYKVTLNDGTQLKDEWMTADELQAALDAYSKDFTNSTQGLIKFSSNGIEGAKVLATFVSIDDKFQPVDPDKTASIEQGIEVNTDKIITKIDLSEWFEALKTVSTSVAPGSTSAAISGITPPGMSGNKGDSFLAGLTYAQITSILDKMGLKAEFKAPGSSTGDQWVLLDNIRDLDPNTNNLYIRFSPKNPANSDTIKVIVDGNEQDNNDPISALLKIDLPLTYKANPDYLSDLQPEGSTINITNIADLKTVEAEIINKLKVDNSDPKLANVEIEIQYSLNEYSIGGNTWMNLDDFQAALQGSNVNYRSNKILAKYVIKNNTLIPGTTQNQFELSNPDPVVIHAEDKTENAAVKIYIHSVDQTNAQWMFDTLKISGPQEGYTIANFDSWFTSVPEGLVVEFNTTYTDALQPDENGWVTGDKANLPKIGAQRKFWVRFKVQPGYEFENALPNTNPAVSAPIELDTSNITVEIPVDLDQLKDNLNFEGTSNNIDLDKLKESEKTILDSIDGGDKLAIKYKVTLNDGTQLKDEWMTADELQAALDAYSKDFTNSTQGLIKFNSNGFNGASIEATFVSNDPNFSVKDPDADVEKGISVNTDKVVTEIDLSNWFDQLKQVATTFDQGSTSASISGITPPGMPGNKGDSQFAGLSYAEIIAILDQMGLKPEFQAPGSSTGDQWVPLDQIHDLDNNNNLNFRLALKDPAISDSIKIIVDSNVQDNNDPISVPLLIKLPKTYTVDVELLKQLNPEGTTINIENINVLKATETQIIDALKALPENAELQDVQIGIQYSLNEISINNAGASVDEQRWMDLDTFQSALSSSKVNFTTNRVLARFVILNNDLIEGTDLPKYQLSTGDTQIIHEENIAADAAIKIYIHSVDATDPTWMFDNLKISGSQEQFTISGYDDWQLNIPKGLEVEFNVTDVNGQPDENAWSNDPYQPIGVNRKYWVRFKVQPGYVFENALPDTDPAVSAPIELDTSKISIVFKLDATWLSNIVLGGTTKNLTINEQAAWDAVVAADSMPENAALLQIQYTVDGKTWFTKDDFIAELDRLDGGLNGTNAWIIRREDIKARWAINQDINDKNDKIGLIQPDGSVVIIDSNDDSTNVQLIDDANNLNSSVTGYINANKFEPFIAENFELTGSSSNAVLKIKNINQFNQMLPSYSSDSIFQIAYKWDENDAFSAANTIWAPGSGNLNDSIKLSGNYAKRFLALSLQSVNDKYIVYRDGNALAKEEGYVIQTPDIKVTLSVEITNPLLDKQQVKEVKITFFDENGEPIWYNNNGAFNVVVVKNDGTEVSFKDFKNQLPEGTAEGQWTAEEKDAMELAYYVSDHELTDEEYAQAIAVNKITDYSTNSSNEKYGVWKSLSQISRDASLDLGLSVNDYVVVALRVKESSLTSDTNPNGYVMKDDEHTPTESQRVFGYKVHVDQIELDTASLQVRNIGAAEDADYGLDGYAHLNYIGLVHDQGNNYQGVEMKMNLYNSIYLDNNGNIITTPSGERLVLRNANGAENKGVYTDANGNPISAKYIDENGQEQNVNQIPILMSNGLPAKPEEFANPTNSHVLEELEPGAFRSTLAAGEKDFNFALYRGQRITFDLMNKKGQAPDDKFDYYIDAEKQLEYTTGNEIKFAVPNPHSVSYRFDAEFNEFIKDEQNIHSGKVYVDTLDASVSPRNGSSKIIANFTMTRTQNDGTSEKLGNIEDPNTLQTLKDAINNDFLGAIELKVTYKPKSSSMWQEVVNADMSTINNLSNGDQFKVEMVPVDPENYIYATAPRALEFTVRGLYGESIEESKLAYLRVRQEGTYNGMGSFRVLVDNPDRPDPRPIRDILEKFDFEIAVWDENKQLVHDWTSDISSINDLRNGWKVAWRMISTDENQSPDSYYNTVANMDKHDANNQKYSFSEIAAKGNGNSVVVRDGKGQLPANLRDYPEDSGFIIDGLIEGEVPFNLDENDFYSTLNSIKFSYEGQNGRGNMNVSADIYNIQFKVTEVDPSNARASKESTRSLGYLIDNGYVTFYRGNSSNSNLNQFNWRPVKDENGVWQASPGILWNGDTIVMRYTGNESNQTFSFDLPDVYGLSQKSGSMSPLTWVGIGAASLATIGLFFFIYFFARNRKLKK